MHTGTCFNYKYPVGFLKTFVVFFVLAPTGIKRRKRESVVGMAEEKMVDSNTMPSLPPKMQQSFVNAFVDAMEARVLERKEQQKEQLQLTAGEKSRLYGTISWRAGIASSLVTLFLLRGPAPALLARLYLRDRKLSGGASSSSVSAKMRPATNELKKKSKSPFAAAKSSNIMSEVDPVGKVLRHQSWAAWTFWWTVDSSLAVMGGFVGMAVGTDKKALWNALVSFPVLSINNDSNQDWSYSEVSAYFCPAVVNFIDKNKDLHAEQKQNHKSSMVGDAKELFFGAESDTDSVVNTSSAGGDFADKTVSTLGQLSPEYEAIWELYRNCLQFKVHQQNSKREIVTNSSSGY